MFYSDIRVFFVFENLFFCCEHSAGPQVFFSVDVW